MAVKKGKKDGSGIQQAAGLIRYFDEESEDAWHISKGMVYAACIILSAVIYLANNGVISWLVDLF
jgi:preprotein translocase subunit Sec61beta